MGLKKVMKGFAIYVHGKGGSADEAEHYKPLFPDLDVIGFDYRANTPWEAEREFPAFFDQASRDHDPVILIANSIGAYFSLHALSESRIDRAYLISPVVDMEGLILGMMKAAGVKEAELKEKGVIPTDFGEPLSWDYLEYVRCHPIRWKKPTRILYGENDALTPYRTMFNFAKQAGAELTVMENGEHWFHTPEQMAFLDQWIKKKEGVC